MGYANGRYPLHLFIHRGGNIYLTPSASGIARRRAPC